MVDCAKFCLNMFACDQCCYCAMDVESATTRDCHESKKCTQQNNRYGQE